MVNVVKHVLYFAMDWGTVIVSTLGLIGLALIAPRVFVDMPEWGVVTLQVLVAGIGVTIFGYIAGMRYWMYRKYKVNPEHANKSMS